MDGNSRELTGQFVGASNKSSKGEKVGHWPVLALKLSLGCTRTYLI